MIFQFNFIPEDWKSLITSLIRTSVSDLHRHKNDFHWSTLGLQKAYVIVLSEVSHVWSKTEQFQNPLRALPIPRVSYFRSKLTNLRKPKTTRSKNQFILILEHLNNRSSDIAESRGYRVRGYELNDVEGV